jgi:hypothetical protein
MTPDARAKQLASDHWNGYIKGLLEAYGGEHGINLSRIHGYNYITAFAHGYKHAVEDCENNMFGMFGEVDEVALEAELDRSCGNAAADAEHDLRTKDLFARGCPTCLDTTVCAKTMKTDLTGKCLYHRSALRERMMEAKEPHTAKQEPPTAADTPLNFALPSIALKCTAEEAWKKFESELKEWRAAELGSAEELIERWDCLQAVQTFYERGGNLGHYQTHVQIIMHDLAKWFSMGRDVMVARAAMVVKNARRNYYAPEVNAAIIATNGASFAP